MNDEQRTPAERIRDLARDSYNAPPETPRSEMWAAIEARLDGETSGEEVRDARALHLRRHAWWVGIAAALIVGLGIGRLSMGTGPAGVQVASEPAAEPSAAETPASGPDEPVAATADRLATEGPGPVGENGRAAAGDRVASGAPEARELPTDARPTDESGRRAAALRHAVATRQLLDRGESLLATVQADLASGGPDPAMEAWARSLLSRTRVLMASPGASAPETRRLLEDLELMLAQIVVTTSTRDPGEARILGEGLEQGDLLYRLRLATEEEEGPGAFRAARTSSL